MYKDKEGIELMRPFRRNLRTKGFIFCLAIFFTLALNKFSLSDTNIPSHQTVEDPTHRTEQKIITDKDIQLHDHHPQKLEVISAEEQKKIPVAIDEFPEKSEQTLSMSPRTDTSIQVEDPTHREDSEHIAYDMPITVNKAVEKNMGYFKNSLSEKFGTWLNRSGRYLSLMRDIFQEKGLPQDLVYLALIESGFNPYAYSWAKAVGPWQFISSTAKRYGLKVNWWVDERRDPVKSTVAAAEYLNDLYDLFGSWNLAMAAYNAGERKVLNGLRRTKSGDFWDLRNTKYIKRETKEYVPRYMAATIIAKNPEMHGFVVDYHEPLKYDEVTVPSPLDLRVIAESAGTTMDEIKELNPELRRWCTPPDQPTYRIRIPEGARETFLSNLETVPENERFTGKLYKFRNGDTLDKVAKSLGVSKKIIIEANSLGKKYKLIPGDTLLIPSGGITISNAKSEKKEIAESNTDQQKRIVYKVKKGDSLHKIAQRHNTSPEKIKEWNGLKNNKLKPGDKLYIFTSLDSPVFF